MEYHTIFAARSREELLTKRYVALPPDLDYLFESIQYLRTHLDDIGETELGIRLNTCWYLIKGFQHTRSTRPLPPMAPGVIENAPVPFGTAMKATHKILLAAFSTPLIIQKHKRGDPEFEGGRAQA